jgi:hypothetical protein
MNEETQGSPAVRRLRLRARISLDVDFVNRGIFVGRVDSLNLQKSGHRRVQISELHCRGVGLDELDAVVHRREVLAV